MRACTEKPQFSSYPLPTHSGWTVTKMSKNLYFTSWSQESADLCWRMVRQFMWEIESAPPPPALTDLSKHNISKGFVLSLIFPRLEIYCRKYSWHLCKLQQRVDIIEILFLKKGHSLFNPAGSTPKLNRRTELARRGMLATENIPRGVFYPNTNICRPYSFLIL